MNVITKNAKPKKPKRPASGTTQVKRQSQPLAATFSELVERWRAETAFLSSVNELVLHPAYQRIIGLGPAAVPLLLSELQRQPDHWFWALHAITGENPVPATDAGNVQKMADAWLKWGKERGYV